MVFELNLRYYAVCELNLRYGVCELNLRYGVCELNLRCGCLYSVSQKLRKVVRACSIFNPHEGHR